MTQDAKQFVDNWITEHVQPTGYEPEGDASAAERLAFECWRAADKAGIKRGLIKEACGNLVEYISEAIERINDDNVKRLAKKDE